MSSMKKLEVQASQLVAEVKAWSRSQVALWQQLPYLALEADGKDGFRDDLSICYSWGYWQLEDSTPRGSYCLCSVDCSTGELVNQVASMSRRRLVLASDEAILPLLLRLDDLDAQRITADLQRTAAKKGSRFIARSNPGWPARQAEIREQNGLGPDRPYIRPTWPGDAATA